MVNAKPKTSQELVAQPVLALPGKISATGLTLPEGLSYDDWEKVGRMLQGVGQSLNWWIGDWLNFGERKYGEMYTQAIEATGRTVENLKNAKWVSNQVEKSLRNDNLSWSHHYMVASLEPKEQREWLGKAEKDELDANELRVEIAADKRTKKLAERQKAEGTGTVHIEQMEAKTFLGNIEPRSVDLLLTDPPYSTDVDDIDAFASGWVSVALDRLKPTGRAYIFTGAYPRELRAYLDELLEWVARAPGWTLDNPLVWTYRNTIGPATAQRYKLNWQACFHVYGPHAPALNAPELVEQFTVQDVSAPDARTGVRLHAWQKPDALAERLILHSTLPGQLVIDPFCGTGTFTAAAARLGRNALGCDLDPEMLALCEKRGLEISDAA